MRLLFVSLFCLVCSGTFAQRDTLAMDGGWRFLIDKAAVGVTQQWFEKELTEARPVTLPHTWNIEDENQNHYGWGWYQKKFTVPSDWKNKSVVLEFGAINHTAFVYLNGNKIAENVGDGFNKFIIDLTGKLAYGKENTVTVAVNNDYGKAKVPFGSSFDWPNDGGLIRTVRLIRSGKPSASHLHATPVLNIAVTEIIKHIALLEMLAAKDAVHIFHQFSHRSNDAISFSKTKIRIGACSPFHAHQLYPFAVEEGLAADKLQFPEAHIC